MVHALEQGAPNHPHSDFIWNIRINEKIVSVFEAAWGTEDLICGFDGMGVSVEKTGTLCWHVDQDGSHIDGCVCLQSMLVLTESSCTEFAVGSHNRHAKLTGGIGRMGWQFVPLQASALAACAKETPKLLVGDLVIWDSRTAHRVLSQNLAQHCPRIVVYLSYVPRGFANISTLRTRRQFFDNGVATTHWPYRLIDRGEDRFPPSRTYKEATPSIRQLIDGNLA